MQTQMRLPEDYNWRGSLMKDNKLVCDIQSCEVPLTLPSKLVIKAYEPASFFPLSALPNFRLYPLAPNPARLGEWQKFLSYLSSRGKVAIILAAEWELLFNPPLHDTVHPKQPVTVSYRSQKQPTSFVPLQPTSSVPLQPTHNIDIAIGFHEPKLCANAGLETKTRSDSSYGSGHANGGLKTKTRSKSAHGSGHARTHPSYLETLGQTHASWIFGALAELIDNARDAKATRLDISIETEYFRVADTHIPVLCVTDNGGGMSHDDLLRMVSFGHKRPDHDDKDLIGRFGVGFKTGAMRLGKDAVVLTQSEATRSIAFLSRSFNEDKDEVEIPTVTYQKNKGWMEFDLTVHSLKEAENGLKAIKEFSPFNEYSIGPKFSAFGEGTGTTVCIYNLDRWGADYTLQWDLQTVAEDSVKNDITIRSRRVRNRPAQMSKEVPLDYSLHAYLEVMFLDPKMKIYVQGTQVKTRRLHKSLNMTKVYRDTLLGKDVELTVGRSKEERDRGNCGIFLYWHGRLIEAYKRVGGMVHTADMGRGIIGVIDVTDIMRLGNDSVAVLNNKQGFLDCEAYATLEDWLGSNANGYWDDHFDRLEVQEKDENAVYTPDHSWVQCNKCLKWRVLDKDFNSKDLPAEWFCYMPPYKGFCATAQDDVEEGVVTTGATRSPGNAAYPPAQIKEEVDQSGTAGGSIVNEKECSDVSVGDCTIKPKERKAFLRRLKRSPATSKGRQAKKTWKSC